MNDLHDLKNLAKKFWYGLLSELLISRRLFYNPVYGVISFSSTVDSSKSNGFMGKPKGEHWPKKAKTIAQNSWCRGLLSQPFYILFYHHNTVVKQHQIPKSLEPYPEPDLQQSEKSDPDPPKSEKVDPDPDPN